MNQLLLVIAFLLLGLIAGKTIEHLHFKKLEAREQSLRHIRVCNLRNIQGVQAGQYFLVAGSVVIATDYFKTFVSGFRNIFGGEMRAYRSLMQRARREALVRLLEQADASGAESVWNVRYETSSIQGKNRPGGVEVLAYGTAVRSK